MEISVRRRDGSAVVGVKGRLIRENQAELRKSLEDVIAEGTRGIVLDFQSLDYVDSAGLGCCASVQRLLKEKGSGGLVLCGASPSIERMWKLIRLDLVIPLFREENEAIAWLQKGCASTP
jgi:anti-anti-sigma factor